MYALLATIPPIALGAEVSAISTASLLSGTITARAARAAKAAAGSAASAATKTTSTETSASRAASTEPTRSATGTAAAREARRLSRGAITILAPTRIVAKTTRTTPETWTEVTTRISADLLQSST